jgi:hypothetical protein
MGLLGGTTYQSRNEFQEEEEEGIGVVGQLDDDDDDESRVGSRRRQ